MSIKIYTDGGCSGNPGPGGWAYVIVRDEVPEDQAAGGKGPHAVPKGKSEILAEKYGGEPNTTNNRMELTAAAAALESLRSLEIPSRRITVFTDSQYLQKGMTLWIRAWKQNAWRTSDRKLVKNRDLWERLDTLSANFQIDWVWIRGHAGNEFNERCDRMTQWAIADLGSGFPAGGSGEQHYLFPL
ncbi:MAG: ribonuclease HI [Spirochaetaceae bacterium]|nr:ribonuclease HI [Spirochaetaceae bacterium]